MSGVRRVERAPEAVLDAWREVLAGQARYSYYQTPPWADLLLRTLPGARAEHRLIEFDDGLRAVWPLISTPKRFGLRKLESLPWGAYGGLLSTTPLTRAHRDAAARAVLGWKTPVLECAGNPLDSASIRAAMKETRILSMNGDPAALWEGFQPRNRTAIRRARENGAAVRMGNSREFVEAFARLYNRASAEYWSGVDTMPDAFFSAMAERPDENLQLWIAEMDGRPACADLIAYGRGEAQYIAGAADRSLTKTHAARALMAAILEDACQRGFEIFNFGGSAGLEGVEQFKRLFGARPAAYPVYRYQWRPLGMVQSNEIESIREDAECR
ncbi:MAG: GNAT family N-acetyltransferase [bacterium]|nr:GNAT family N-acetyltransferase [bacterium]